GQFRFMWDHMNDSDRRCIRNFVENGRVEKEEQHIYEDLKRSGYFIEDDRGARLFSSAFGSVISRPRVITTELVRTDRAAMAIHEARIEKIVAPPLIEPKGYIGRFTIRRSLGSGGMGEIFEGRDTELQRTVAIKVLASRYIEDETMKRRFVREARLASQLNHANIATIYEIGEAAGNPYIVMEYVQGQTLADALKASMLSIKSVLEIGQQIAEALAEAHERGVVHRDIKSANIMITGKGQVKVLDFGLAKPLRLFESKSKKSKGSKSGQRSTESLTESGILLGTVSYMSPEQAAGEGKINHLSDLFSLGVVLYEATTGQLPFDGDTYFQTIEAITRIEPKPVQSFRDDAPVELVVVITRLLQKSPASRYQSGVEVSADLKAIPRGVTGSL
ncbi:MAG TPA: serine/threonine-protein kinase, partial [Blastocatellia bacterium]